MLTVRSFGIASVGIEANQCVMHGIVGKSDRIDRHEGTDIRRVGNNTHDDTTRTSNSRDGRRLATLIICHRTPHERNLQVGDAIYIHSRHNGIRTILVGIGFCTELQACLTVRRGSSLANKRNILVVGSPLFAYRPARNLMGIRRSLFGLDHEALALFEMDCTHLACCLRGAERLERSNHPKRFIVLALCLQRHAIERIALQVVHDKT